MAKDKDKDEAPPTSVGQQLIELLGQAKPEDLAELDSQIAVKQQELAGLQGVRTMLARALGVEEPKKGPGRKPSSNGQPAGASGGGAASEPSLRDQRRVVVARYLMTHGATSGAKLGQLFGIPTGSQTAVLECDWFERKADGYVITPTGRTEAQKAG